MTTPVASLSGNRIEQRVEQGRRVVRRYWSDVQLARQLGADHATELTAHYLAASEGVAPAVIGHDLSAGWLELEWIDGGVVDIDHLLSTPARAGLWKLLAKLRLLEPANVPALHVPQRVEELLARLATFDSRAASAWQQRWGCLRVQADRFAPQGFAPCLVHGDLNSPNLLTQLDGRLVCIDWEYAHAGHPLEDLAGLICSSRALQLEWLQVQQSDGGRADWWPQSTFDDLGQHRYADAVHCLRWWVDARSTLDGIWMALAAHFAGNGPSA